MKAVLQAVIVTVLAFVVGIVSSSLVREAFAQAPPVQPPPTGPAEFIEWKVSGVYVDTAGKKIPSVVGKLKHLPTGRCWVVYGSQIAVGEADASVCAGAPQP